MDRNPRVALGRTRPIAEPAIAPLPGYDLAKCSLDGFRLVLRGSHANALSEIRERDQRQQATCQLLGAPVGVVDERLNVRLKPDESAGCERYGKPPHVWPNTVQSAEPFARGGGRVAVECDGSKKVRVLHFYRKLDAVALAAARRGREPQPCADDARGADGKANFGSSSGIDGDRLRRHAQEFQAIRA